MPRDLVVGNGSLLVTFDRDMTMRDLYWPHVGLWNHIGGHRSRFGVWVDGRFAWFDEPGWEKRLAYERDSLVTRVEARHAELGLALFINDGAHYWDNSFVRRMTVENLLPAPREVRLFFHQDFSLEETEVGDCAVYDPKWNAVYHYKRNSYILVNAQCRHGGIFEFAIGTKRFNGAEGTWRDAEDGTLGGNAIAQGSVDSTVSLRLFLEGGSAKTAYYWLCCGRNYSEVVKLNHKVLERTPEHMLHQITEYWRHWVEKAPAGCSSLPPRIESLYRQSLLIIRTQVDKQGAIIAANDSDIMHYNRDHYSYMWPRDGALVALSLIEAGYPELTAGFFQFCRQALTKDGFLLQKYNADGSAGSSWHPWLQNGQQQLPIQQDETALVLFALWSYYQETRDIELITSLKRSLIQPAADFLMTYVYPELQLPRESYDLWEERRGIFAWTTGAVCGGLRAAGHLHLLYGDDLKANHYYQAAARIQQGIQTLLWDGGLNRFVRGLTVQPDHSVLRDRVVDASLYGLCAFGAVPSDDPRMQATMEAVRESLWVRTGIGGLARYEGDYYFQADPTLPGNPWLITTLWLAQWQIAVARSQPELDRSLELILWAADRCLPSGVMPEQLHPHTGAPLSVAPLTWSHAEFVRAVTHYIRKQEALQAGERTREGSGA
jgi:GH15 family glucan-1,4-alpha-glucosidase